MTATWLLVIVVVSTQSRHVDSFPAAAIFEKPIYGCPGRTFGTRIPVDEEEPIDDGVQDESWTAPSVEDETEGWHGVSGPTAPGIEELMQSGQTKDWTPVDEEEPTEEGTQDDSWTAPSVEDETEGWHGVSGPTAPGIEELMQSGQIKDWTPVHEEPTEEGTQDESWTAPSVEDETERSRGVSGPTAPGIEELMQGGQMKNLTTPVHEEEPTEEGTQDESWTAPSIEDETEGSRGVSGPTAPGIEELMQAMSELHEVVVNTRKDVNDTKKNTSVIPEMYGDVHKIQGNVNTTSRELQHTTASSCQSKACSYLTL